jgi:hypothetical protein
MSDEQPSKPSAGPVAWDPYFAGFMLGLVLLAAFLLVGRGLGAVGGMQTLVATTMQGLGALGFAHYQGPANPLDDWLVLEVVGMVGGGLWCAWRSGPNRSGWSIARGPQMGAAQRLVAAIAGGVLMAVGSRLAGGCTSGQALTGGAVLSPGSWLFMGMVFVGAYAVAWPLRRWWI